MDLSIDAVSDRFSAAYVNANPGEARANPFLSDGTIRPIDATDVGDLRQSEKKQILMMRGQAVQQATQTQQSLLREIAEKFIAPAPSRDRVSPRGSDAPASANQREKSASIMPKPVSLSSKPAFERAADAVANSSVGRAATAAKDFVGDGVEAVAGKSVRQLGGHAIRTGEHAALAVGDALTGDFAAASRHGGKVLSEASGAVHKAEHVAERAVTKTTETFTAAARHVGNAASTAAHTVSNAASSVGQSVTATSRSWLGSWSPI